MLSLSGTQRIFLCQKPVDFRKAHDGLCAIVRNEFQDDAFAGDVFAFFNRAKDRIKLLVWTETDSGSATSASRRERSPSRSQARAGWRSTEGTCR